MVSRTSVDRPASFQLEEGGEYYCIESEVGNYLNFRGSLHKKYPGLIRRVLKNEERKKLAALGLSQHIQTSNLSLLRQVEVDEIIEGDDEKYKSSSAAVPSVDPCLSNSSNEDEDDSEAAVIASLESIPEIGGRYTDDDTEFAEEWISRLPPPPVMMDWIGGSQGRRGRGSGGYDRGNHSRNDNDRGYKRRYDNQDGNDDRYNKYPRREDNYNRGSYSGHRGGYDRNSSGSNSRNPFN